MTSPSETVTLAARAKLNLRLEIFGRRPDGLHELRSLMAELALADELSILASPAGFYLECEGALIPERENLAWRAATTLGVDLSGLRVQLRKHIPTQAGLGGGSADAAAMLRVAAERARERGHAISDAALMRFAAQLGSDVPACLLPGFKLVEGAGETVRPLAISPPPWGIVLLQPAARVSTPDAYRLLDESRGMDVPSREGDAVDTLCAAIGAGDFLKACSLLHNDFLPAVAQRFTSIARAQERLRAVGAAATLLCGSGSCVAGFFETTDAARRAHAEIRLSSQEWSCATTFADA
jgi:4-diphosphocytidyl-2-C-methyl-D-erythritol kinase